LEAGATLCDRDADPEIEAALGWNPGSSSTGAASAGGSSPDGSAVGGGGAAAAVNDTSSM
jgi:hypothetical protein